MGKRFVLLFVCVAAVMALTAPAALAAISLTGMSPNYGADGTTVTCTVSGTFWVETLFVDALAPTFKLVNGATTIDGTTTGWDDTSASVTFTLPASAPQGSYELDAAQSHKPKAVILYSKDLTALADAFYVYDTPVITSINPTSVAVGSADLALTVNGSSFYTSGLLLGYRSVVRFNGEGLTTTLVTPTQLTATVPAAKLATAGTASITVFNRPGVLLPGGFGGVSSNAVTLTIGSPAPTVTAISPTSVWAGSVKPDVLLTVTGTNFVNGSRIVVSGGDKAGTTFVSATQLTALLTPAEMALPGPSLMISVKNPPFPPGTSSAGGLPLALQPETTTPSVTIGGADGAWHKNPVPLTFTATDAESGVQKVQYMASPGVAAWTDGTSYTVPTTNQGAIQVSVQALDWCNKVGTAQATVYIDTTQPETETLNDPSVKKGKTAKLKYRINEPAGLSQTADVTIKIKRKSGSTAKTLTYDDVPMNTDQTASFKCTLSKGTYTWYVYAVDLAGNKQGNVAQAKLTSK